MIDALDYGILRTKIWFSNLKDEFRSDERGVSGIVATVVLVLLAVALAVIFWDKIQTVVDNLFTSVTTEQQKLPSSGG